MRSALLLISMSLVAIAAAQEATSEPQYDMRLRQLVLFVKPESAPKIAREQAEKTQKAHLDYLERLWKERKLLLVGPVADGGRIKGICLVDVEKAEDAIALLKEDPRVLAGELEIETKSWYVARNVPQLGPKFLDVEPLWFGFLRRPKDAPSYSEAELKAIQKGHMANIEAMAATGDLVLAGPIDDPELRGIFIFRTPSKERVMELASSDPAIQKGRLKLELLQWFASKGTFPKP